MKHMREQSVANVSPFQMLVYSDRIGCISTRVIRYRMVRFDVCLLRPEVSIHVRSIELELPEGIG